MPSTLVGWVLPLTPHHQFLGGVSLNLGKLDMPCLKPSWLTFTRSISESAPLSYPGAFGELHSPYIAQKKIMWRQSVFKKPVMKQALQNSSGPRRLGTTWVMSPLPAALRICQGIMTRFAKIQGTLLYPWKQEKKVGFEKARHGGQNFSAGEAYSLPT